MRNKENQQPVIATGKLTQEQKKQILNLVEKNGYDLDKLHVVFYHIGKQNIEDFVTDIDILIEDYLGCAPVIKDCAQGGLHKLFSLNRILASISGKL